VLSLDNGTNELANAALAICGRKIGGRSNDVSSCECAWGIGGTNQ
jgi:hypothetical protein